MTIHNPWMAPSDRRATGRGVASSHFATSIDIPRRGRPGGGVDRLRRYSQAIHAGYGWNGRAQLPLLRLRDGQVPGSWDSGCRSGQ